MRSDLRLYLARPPQIRATPPPAPLFGGCGSSACMSASAICRQCAQSKITFAIGSKRREIKQDKRCSLRSIEMQHLNRQAL
jgi:hypothetical protein